MSKWRDREEFKAKVREWAGKIDVRIRSVAIRQMSNKWASCSTAGNMSFNKELLRLEQSLGEYVIVHELLHLRVPNHGKLWKSLMRAYLGNFERKENKLRRLSDGARKRR